MGKYCIYIGPEPKLKGKRALVINKYKGYVRILYKGDIWYVDKNSVKEIDEEYGNRADHYTRLNPSTVQRFHDARSGDEFVGAMLFNIIKYAERFGHKDDKLKEAMKMRDYAQMLVNHYEGKRIQ